VPELQLWYLRLREIEERCSLRVNQRLRDLRQKLDMTYNRLVQASPQKKLALQKEKLYHFETRLFQLIDNKMKSYNIRLQRTAALLQALSPLQVFERGYSLIQSPHGKILRSVKDLNSGDIIEIKLKDGNKSASII
jgi:exodeoxyribonuclease VII large subunit